MRTETQALPNTRKPRDDEIDVHGLTHVGRVRKENQDHFLLATVHKRVNVIATNLATQSQLPARRAARRVHRHGGRRRRRRAREAPRRARRRSSR